MSGELGFNEVVNILEEEVEGENWQIVERHDIGAAIKSFGKYAHNKVIPVCKTQYLARVIEEDPFVSLIIPCRCTVFRDSTE